MGSLYKLGRIRKYILFFLILIALLVSVPLRNSMSNLFDKKVKDITSLLYKQTGLTIKYQSLSPSILSSISMKGISVYNSQDEEILEIKKAKVGFKLSKLLKLDIQNGISHVLLDGIRLDLDNLEKLLLSLNLQLGKD